MNDKKDGAIAFLGTGIVCLFIVAATLVPIAIIALLLRLIMWAIVG